MKYFLKYFISTVSTHFGCGTHRASIKSIAALERSHQSSSGNSNEACKDQNKYYAQDILGDFGASQRIVSYDPELEGEFLEFLI